MDTEFDEKLERMDKQQRTNLSGDSVLSWPTWNHVRDSSVFVTDTLDLCWVAAKSIFGEKASPEHALAIYDRMTERLETIAHEGVDDAMED
jgi:hypothetical protein